MRLALYLLACLAGVALALLGDEPPIGLALAAVILYPLGASFVAGGEQDDRARSGSAPPSSPARPGCCSSSS